mmetsp:Transcript_8846/g.13183  ORF Transcript_8846/g.13183 Transcript_8846/m.13183 type:complete len:259 (-) Transcript_8846:1244-2020(-)
MSSLQTLAFILSKVLKSSNILTCWELNLWFSLMTFSLDLSSCVSLSCCSIFQEYQSFKVLNSLLNFCSPFLQASSLVTLLKSASTSSRLVSKESSLLSWALVSSSSWLTSSCILAFSVWMVALTDSYWAFLDSYSWLSSWNLVRLLRSSFTKGASLDLFSLILVSSCSTILEISSRVSPFWKSMFCFTEETCSRASLYSENPSMPCCLSSCLMDLLASSSWPLRICSVLPKTVSSALMSFSWAFICWKVFFLALSPCA